MSGLSFSCCHRQEYRQRQTYRFRCAQRQELTMEQRHEQRQTRLDEGETYYQYFLDFINTAFGLKIRPQAKCPKCEYDLRIGEIILGFKADVNDLTTECPRCKSRFIATNLVNRSTGKEIPFFCPDQVLNKMTGLENLEADVIRVKYPDIYETAIFHFGSLLNAFGRKGIEYRREKLDWTTKARAILGKVPDRDIAKVFGVNVREVSAKRKEFGLERFTGKRTLIPADWKPLEN